MRDPDYWQDADQFKPERFIDEFGNYKADERNIPFMLGKRVCIGQVNSGGQNTACNGWKMKIKLEMNIFGHINHLSSNDQVLDRFYSGSSQVLIRL